MLIGSRYKRYKEINKVRLTLDCVCVSVHACACVIGREEDNRGSTREEMEEYKERRVKSKQTKTDEENLKTLKCFYLEAVSWACCLLIGHLLSWGCEGFMWLVVSVEEAGLDAAEGAEHPGMLAPDLPLQLVPLAGNHMEDILQTWRARDVKMNQTERGEWDERGFFSEFRTSFCQFHCPSLHF